MGRNILFVIGMPIGRRFGIDQVTLDDHLEYPACRGHQKDVEGLAELVKDRLRHAHGTAGVVSSPAKLDDDASHGNHSGSATHRSGHVERQRYGSVMLFDFSNITPATIAAETEKLIQDADVVVAKLVAGDADTTYSGRLAPLEEVAALTAQGFTRTGFMGYVHPEAEVRAAGKEAEERLSKWGVELAFREDVYAAVKALADSPAAQGLDGERGRLLTFSMRDFIKAGHGLAAEKKNRLKDLANRLVELSVLFERNIAEDDRGVEVVADDLAGLPPEYVESLEDLGGGRYKVSMAYPHVIPVLDGADNRDLRQKVSFVFNTRAIESNRELLAEAVAIRREIAGLFETPSWAHHKLDEQMAKTPEAVDQFYANLLPSLTEAGHRDIARMASMLEADTGDTVVRSYDWRYYDNRLRMTDFGVDQNEVATYFALDSVVTGMLDITADVFCLRYELVDASTWHPDVTTYAIFDADGAEPIAHFYMDLFPRDGKFSHAAAFPLRPGRSLEDGSYQAPVSAIVANFTKPVGGRPSLLRHTEVETLFHEFGHVLHQTLTRAELVRFSGTSTERDFVEAPSQIMQHWVWKPEVLTRFARHHQTGDPIPANLVDQLAAARQLNVAIAKLRQAVFGKLDMMLHGPSGEGKTDEEILAEANAIGLFPLEEGTYFPASFGHLVGGYDAGYYGYLWSEVYGDDMFSRFEEEGYLSQTVGRDYRKSILEPGGSIDGMDLLRRFLGREPNNAAFLRNLGIRTD